MLPIRFRPNVALLTVLLVAAAGCSGDRGAPVTTETDSPALATAPAATVSFACASGREIMVAYPDTGSVRLTYLGQEYAMAQTPVASGARYAGADMVWTSSVADDGERAVLSRVGADGSSSGTVLERPPAGRAFRNARSGQPDERRDGRAALQGASTEAGGGRRRCRNG